MESRNRISHEISMRKESLEATKFLSKEKIVQGYNQFHSRHCKTEGGSIQKKTANEHELGTDSRSSEVISKVLEDEIVPSSRPNSERKITREKKRLSFLFSKMIPSCSSDSSKADSSARSSISFGTESDASSKWRGSSVSAITSQLEKHHPNFSSPEAPNPALGPKTRIDLLHLSSFLETGVSYNSNDDNYLEFKLLDGRLVENMQQQKCSGSSSRELCIKRSSSMLKMQELMEEIPTAVCDFKKSAHYSAFCFPDSDNWPGRLLNCLESTVFKEKIQSFQALTYDPLTELKDNSRPSMASAVQGKSFHSTSACSSQIVPCDPKVLAVYDSKMNIRNVGHEFGARPVASRRNISVRYLGYILSHHPALRSVTQNHQIPEEYKALWSTNRKKRREIKRYCANPALRASEDLASHGDVTASYRSDALETTHCINIVTDSFKTLETLRNQNLISQQIPGGDNSANSLHALHPKQIYASRRQSNSFSFCSSHLSTASLDALYCLGSTDPELTIQRQSLTKLEPETDHSCNESLKSQEKITNVVAKNIGKLPTPNTVTISSASTLVDEIQSTRLKHGKLQSEWRDGALAYNFWMENSDEVLVARTQKTGSAQNGKGSEQSFTIFSWKGRPKGKSSWKGWGRREKQSLFANSILKIKTSMNSEAGPSDNISYFLDSECVLLKQESRDETTFSGNLNPTARFSSWEASAIESPCLLQKSASCPTSPKMNRFSGGNDLSLEVPTEIAFWKAQCGGDKLLRPSTKKNLLQTAIINQVNRLMPPHALKDQNQRTDRVSLHCASEGSLEASSQANGELAAMVIRQPIITKRSISSFGGHSSSILQWSSWSEKVLKQSSIPKTDNNRNKSSLLSSTLNYAKFSGRTQNLPSFSKPGQAPLTSSRITRSLFDGHNHNYENLEQSFMDDQQSEGNIQLHGNQASIAIIMPAGEHGCPTYGISGPQPLIERWRSGGKCDCGSWDLGCGLVVLDNHHSQADSGKSGSVDCGGGANGQTYNKLLEMRVQGNHQKEPALSLTSVTESLCLLDFTSPLSPIQAFAMAVAVLHSRSMPPPRNLPSAREGTRGSARKPPRVPNTSVMAKPPLSVPVDEIIPVWCSSFKRRNSAYSRGRPLDHPFSPIERV